MKKKIILGLFACLFVAGTIINIQMVQNYHSMDYTLDDISVMAQADGESGEQHGLCVWEYSTGAGGIFFVICPYCNKTWGETDDFVTRVPCQVP